MVDYNGAAGLRSVFRLVTDIARYFAVICRLDQLRQSDFFSRRVGKEKGFLRKLYGCPRPLPASINLRVAQYAGKIGQETILPVWENRGNLSVYTLFLDPAVKK